MPDNSSDERKYPSTMTDTATPLPFTLANHDEAPTRGGSSLDAMPCCGSLTNLLPPPHIVDAAETVREWMETNGYRNWQLGGVCDRRFADECKRLKSACDKWSEAETLHPLMHCQTCGQIRGMDHACDSLHNK